MSQNPLPHDTIQKTTADPAEPPPRSRKRWCIPILFCILAVISLPLSLGVAGVLTYLMPHQYASRATIQIHLPGSLNLFGPATQRISPTFILVQFEIIKSREVLNAVIKKLDLQQRWNEPTLDSTYTRLLKMINVRELRHTDMVSITVYSPDPEEAAMLANTIAEEYRSIRAEMEKRSVSSGLEALQKEETNLELERIKRAAPEVIITMWEKATPSSHYARPHTTFNMLISGGIGLLFSGAFAFAALIAFLIIKTRPCTAQ